MVTLQILILASQVQVLPGLPYPAAISHCQLGKFYTLRYSRYTQAMTDLIKTDLIKRTIKPTIKNHMQNWNELVLDENLEQTIFNHVANSGTLTGLCEDWEIPYYKLAAWVNSDDERKKNYDASVQFRGEWYRETVFSQLRDLSNYNIIDAYDDSGETRNLTEIPKALQNAIHSIKKTIKSDKDGAETITMELKFFDKIKAINLLGKECGMFQQKVEVSGKLSLEDLVSKSFNSD